MQHVTRVAFSRDLVETLSARPVGDSCVAVSIPPNAELTVLGNDWTCRRGFRRVGDGYVASMLDLMRDGLAPVHDAFLVYSSQQFVRRRTPSTSPQRPLTEARETKMRGAYVEVAGSRFDRVRLVMFTSVGIPILTPEHLHQRRWMMFIDGENLVVRGQAVAKAENVTLQKGEHWMPDVYLWMPGHHPRKSLTNSPETLPVQQHGIRAYYYTSLIGSEDDVRATKDLVRGGGFYPVVHKRPANTKRSKGVDIALTIDMLRGAYMSLYDVAVLVTGDADYIPVVHEVQRLGKNVYLIGFDHPAGGLNPDLRLASDQFFDMTGEFCKQWSKSTASPLNVDVQET
jgi:hypothetical protein